MSRGGAMKRLGLVCLAGIALTSCTQQAVKPTAETAPPPSAAPAAATAAEADAFIAGINDDLRTMLPYVNSAQWLQATYITDDSQAIASKANEEFLGCQA